MIARLVPFRLPLPPPWLVLVLAGFVYWVVFLLVLEPGNILRAHRAGRELTLDHEALRITAAACLGTAATPLALWLSRRFHAPRRLSHMAALLAGLSGLSVVLIVVSCFLAAWIFQHAWLPEPGDVADTMTGNGLLVLFALVAFCALERTVLPLPDARPREGDGILRHVRVKARGREFMVGLDTVAWIEAQGNYLALHQDGATHLIRGTIGDMSGRLDTQRFVRIHRSAIVAVERIAAAERFDDGDGRAWLKDGTELKISRSYRKAFFDCWRVARP